MARSGLYVQLDSNFPDDDKIEDVGLAGAGLYAQALCIAKRLNEDGRIRRAKLVRLGADDDLIDLCVSVGLFTAAGDSVMITAWTNHNESAVDIAAKRSRDAARKRVTRGKRPPGHPDTSIRTSDERPNGRADTGEEEEEEEEHPIVDVPSTGGEIRSVFDAWVESTGRDAARTKLDDKRRRLIRTRLKDWPVDDLIAAVQGWRHDPHLRGENDRRTTYNDLDLLLRDAKHIEQLRDLENDQADHLGPTGNGQVASWLA